MVCFVTDVLQRVVVSSTISFFVSFHIGSLDDKVQSDRVVRLNPIHQYATNMKS